MRPRQRPRLLVAVIAARLLPRKSSVAHEQCRICATHEACGRVLDVVRLSIALEAKRSTQGRQASCASAESLVREVLTRHCAASSIAVTRSR